MNQIWLFLALLLGFSSIATAQTGYTNRLDPVVIASDNDICVGDEVTLNVGYTLPLNSSLLLNGIDELVNIPSAPGFDFGSATNFTVEFYIKTSSLAPVMSVVSKIDGINPGFAVGLNNGFVSAFITDGTNLISTIGSTPLADGNWHHVAVVFERTNRVTLYLDGFFENDQNISGVGNIDNTELLRIGAANTGGGNLGSFFTGYLDEVRIWNSARTTAELGANRNLHLNPSAYPNLVGYWDMNDISAPSIIDCGSAGATGQMVNSASLSADAPPLSFNFLPRWDTGPTGASLVVNPEDTTTYRAEVGYCKYLSIDSVTVNVLLCGDINIEDTLTTIWIPSAFTPNGDYKNDVFQVQGFNIDFYDIKIFNRMGNIVYHSQNILKGWDGTFDGNPVQEGMYVYFITYRGFPQGTDDGVEIKEYTRQGTIALMR